MPNTCETFAGIKGLMGPNISYVHAQGRWQVFFGKRECAMLDEMAESTDRFQDSQHLSTEKGSVTKEIEKSEAIQGIRCFLYNQLGHRPLYCRWKERQPVHWCAGNVAKSDMRSNEGCHLRDNNNANGWNASCMMDIQQTRAKQYVDDEASHVTLNSRERTPLVNAVVENRKALARNSIPVVEGLLGDLKISVERHGVQHRCGTEEFSSERQLHRKMQAGFPAE